jgi:hypothetical protein
VRVPEEPGAGRLWRPWIWRLRSRLRSHAILANDYVVGLGDSGSLTTDRAVALLAGLREGVTEMYFHPSTRRCPEIDRDMPAYRHEDELRTLLSPEFRRAIDATGAELIAYRDLTEPRP